MADVGSGSAAAPTGVSAGGGSRASGGIRLTDALGAVGGGAAASGGVRLLAGFLPTVAGVTPVTLVALTATLTPGGAPLIAWELSEDSDPVGFHLFGAAAAEGPWIRLTGRMLEASARSYVDERPSDGPTEDQARWYRLSAISREGNEVLWSLAVSVTPGPSRPTRLALPPNTPNPFRAVTTLTLELPTAGAVRLEIFDLAGRRVATLQDGDLPAGRHALLWDGETVAGPAASGVYWARLEAAGQVVSRKIIVRR